MSAPGPYIVTHRHPPEHDGATGWERRWACATLEHAKHRARLLVYESTAIPRYAGQVTAISDSGGTIKLPDGSEIVVEATTWSALHNATYPPRSKPYSSASDAEIVAAWNAEYGTPGGQS